jgi:hypothetical protein
VPRKRKQRSSHGVSPDPKTLMAACRAGRTPMSRKIVMLQGNKDSPM